MGLKEILASSVDLSKVDTGAVGMVQYGIFGNKILSEAKKMQEEKEAEGKPGKYCEKLCPVNENCQACLVLQQKFEELMSELEKMEQAFENPQAAVTKMIKKCSLCGAPYEKGEKLCPYCDTPYPSDGIGFEIPQSKQEQDQLLINKASEVYNAYYTFWKMASENRQKAWKDKMPGIIQSAANSFASTIDEMMKLTPEQIYSGARQHNLRMSEYIREVMAGRIKSQKVEQLEEKNKQLEEYNQRQQEYNQRNMQIEQERQEKLRRINYEKNQALGNLVYSKSVDWASANAVKDGCWNCVYYNGRNGMCNRTDTRVFDEKSCCVFHS